MYVPLLYLYSPAEVTERTSEGLLADILGHANCNSMRRNMSDDTALIGIN